MKPNIQLKNSFLLSLIILLSAFTTVNAQLAESFETALAPSDTTPAGWSQQAISGSLGVFPNGFKRAGVGSFPIGSFSAVTAFDGNNVIKYNNRMVMYPGMSGAPIGSEAVLISRSLDWSARNGNSVGSIAMRFYRDPMPNNGVSVINDRIEVYLNNQSDLSGAEILTDVATAATTIPRSSSLSPTAAAGWQLLTYNTPGYGNPKWDTCATVYVLIKAICAGGNNMFIDSVSAPEWTLLMALNSSLFNQNKTIQLFPNPADKYVSLKSELRFDKNSSIGIYDLTGRKITAEYNFMDEYTAHINTQNLVNGSYMVKTIVEGKVKLKKLVIAR